MISKEGAKLLQRGDKANEVNEGQPPLENKARDVEVVHLFILLTHLGPNMKSEMVDH